MKAGEIAKKVRNYAEKYVKPGMKLLDIAERLESLIRELGGEPAFPVNISINEIAAHYTPTINDETTVPENALVKIDIGVHVDGFIADTATSITFNPIHEPLVEASRKALEKALSVIKPDIRAYEIGRIIEETIRSMGFQPIRNLAGHSIDKYVIHSGLSIPNHFDKTASWKLKAGAYAIEPFATTGIGLVKEDSVITILGLKPGKLRVRLSNNEKKVVDFIWSTRRSLPFCERWLKHMFSSVLGLRGVLSSLIRKGMLITYPVLVEKTKGIVSQFEHTILINGKEIIVTTL